eukprot:COSAG06_NODE_371_length_16707_cov_57.805576_9_plen_217_part_00
MPRSAGNCSKGPRHTHSTISYYTNLCGSAHDGAQPLDQEPVDELDRFQRDCSPLGNGARSGLQGNTPTEGEGTRRASFCVVFPEKPLHDCPHIRISLLGTGEASRRARSATRSDCSSVSWPVTSANFDSSSAVALSPPNSSAGGSPSCCEASDAEPRRARRDIGFRRRSGKGAASGRASAKVRGLRTSTTQKAPSGARSGARAGQGLAKPLAGAAS